MSLSNDIRRAKKRLTSDTDRKLRGVCLGLSNRIIQRTPVGDPDLWGSPPPPGYIGGTLRNAWRASVGIPSVEVGDTPDENAGAANGALAAAVGQLEAGQTFYMANNMPYAKRVEDGWSQQQAPAGMVAVTLAEAGYKAEDMMRG